jgi:hypothetical protein
MELVLTSNLLTQRKELFTPLFYSMDQFIEFTKLMLLGQHTLIYVNIKYKLLKSILYFFHQVTVL